MRVVIPPGGAAAFFFFPPDDDGIRRRHRTTRIRAVVVGGGGDVNVVVIFIGARHRPRPLSRRVAGVVRAVVAAGREGGRRRIAVVDAAQWCLQRGSARAATVTGASPGTFCVGHSGEAEPALRAMR